MAIVPDPPIASERGSAGSVTASMFVMKPASARPDTGGIVARTHENLPPYLAVGFLIRT